MPSGQRTDGAYPTDPVASVGLSYTTRDATFSCKLNPTRKLSRVKFTVIMTPNTEVRRRVNSLQQMMRTG